MEKPAAENDTWNRLIGDPTARLASLQLDERRKGTTAIGALYAIQVTDA